MDKILKEMNEKLAEEQRLLNLSKNQSNTKLYH